MNDNETPTEDCSCRHHYIVARVDPGEDYSLEELPARCSLCGHTRTFPRHPELVFGITAKEERIEKMLDRDYQMRLLAGGLFSARGWPRR